MKQKSLAKWLIPLLLIVAVLAAVIIPPVIARYIKSSDEVKNDGSPADSVDPSIKEDFDGVVKKDVYVEVGKTDYPVYVRVLLVFNWQTVEDGTVVNHEVQPTKTDYELKLKLTDDGWTTRTVKGYTYYFYQQSVASEGKTSVLIESCKQTGEPPAEGYKLNVEIITQTVQAVGFTDDGTKKAWEQAWNISS